MIDELGIGETPAVAQNYRMQEKLANVIIDADALRRTYKRSWFLALSKHAPLRHRAQNMLDSPLKRGAITPGFCHPALNLGPTCLTMELDEFPHIRRHIEKEGMRARNHRPVNRNSLITCSGSDALQRCSLQRFGLVRNGIPNPGENSQCFSTAAIVGCAGLDTFESPRETSLWLPAPLRSSRGRRRHPTTLQRSFGRIRFFFCRAYLICPRYRQKRDNGFFDAD